MYVSVLLHLMMAKLLDGQIIGYLRCAYMIILYSFFLF